MPVLEDIKKTTIFQAPISKVWKVVSTSEGISEWFMPNDFEAKVGHEFHLQSPFGPSPCKVLEINEPTKIVFSWDTEGWIVTFLLEDLGDKTQFSLIHSGWKDAEDIQQKANEKTTVVRDRMNGGWENIVNEKLRRAVEE